MKKEIEMKKQVLDMLSQFLMDEDGKRFAPKSMTMDVAVVKPAKSGLQDVLDEASEKNPVDMEVDQDDIEGMRRTGKSMDDWEHSPEDMAEDAIEDEDEMDEDCDDEMPKRMTLKEFLKSRS